MRSLVWKLALAALTLALVAAPMLRAPAAWAAAQAPALQEAQKLYDAAQFNEAIAKIRDALSTGQLTGNDAIAARALQARCQVKTGNRLEAKEGFKFVLRQEPGYKLDANSAGPDEQEVFQLAKSELTAEQLEAGKRIPASLSFSYGRGAGDNKDMAEIAVAGGGSDKYDDKPQFGGSVRFPVTKSLMLDLELQRLRATNVDGNAPPNEVKYTVTGYPLSVSLYWSAYNKRMFRLYAFGGGGLLSSAMSSIEFGSFGGTPITVSGQKNGSYFHGGLELEAALHRRIALTGRVMERYAKANGVLDDYTFAAYGIASLKDRSIDFSGFAATIGLRAYIGY